MTPTPDDHTDALIGRTLLDVLHDLNGLLASLRAALELARLDLESEHPAAPMVGTALEAAAGIDALRTWLLSVARHDDMPRHAVCLNALIQADLPMLTRLLGARVRISAHLAADLGFVLAEMTPLRRVMLNLVVNARDACEHGGHVVITTTNRTIDGVPYVVLGVRDNGVGMSAELRERVLGGDGYTTKENGTGRGLAVCRRIVAWHGGRLAVASAEQYGTLVTIALPVLDAAELAG